MRIFATIFAGLLGLAFGSFLNVCLSRWPAGESIVRPGSHCRNCNRTLAWWENIPLLSWLALRGRCHTCHATISWRYPLVELAVGGLWAAAIWRGASFAGAPVPLGLGGRLLHYPETPFFFALWLFLFWALVALACFDAE